jgi:hypothetical protein
MPATTNTASTTFNSAIVIIRVSLSVSRLDAS